MFPDTWTYIYNNEYKTANREQVINIAVVGLYAYNATSPTPVPEDEYWIMLAFGMNLMKISFTPDKTTKGDEYFK